MMATIHNRNGLNPLLLPEIVSYIADSIVAQIARAVAIYAREC
jgi:hypothetical protein